MQGNPALLEKRCAPMRDEMVDVGQAEMALVFT
jgi:hypothetical protein